MPTFRHGRNTRVLFDTLDLSAYFNDGKVNRSMAPGDVTCYTNASKNVIAGLQDGTISTSGFFDGSAGAIEEYLESALQAATDPLITFAPEALTIGRHTFIGTVSETSMSIGAPVADVVTTAADWQCNKGVWNARSLHDLTAETTSTNSTSIDDGLLGVGTTYGAIAVLHITANSMNDTTIIKVQHSTDDAVWADLITFTTVGATTLASERKTVASGVTCNRYIRCTSTFAGTGSCTFSVSFGRGDIA